MSGASGTLTGELRVEVPPDGYHRDLIACQVACPVHTDARGYVRAIAEGRFEEAYLIARGPNPFASICGRICGAPCEAACRRGRIPRVDDDGRFVATDRPIAIRVLKRFVCDRFGPEARRAAEVVDGAMDFVPPVAGGPDEIAALVRTSFDGRVRPGEGQRIAIIGSGPAGLSAAHDLALMGFKPVVFEREPVAAGMLAVGVPAYRLPRDLIAREVAVIQALGAEIRCGVTIGTDVTFADLRRDFAAVIIAVGAKGSRALGIPGESGPGVFGGVDLLRAVALGEPPAIGRDVVVIGGGNVAFDVARTVVRQVALDTARTAARLAATSRVRLVSLESLEEMPADTIEIVEGDEEGVERLNGWGPVAVERDAHGAVTGVTVRRCRRVYDEQRRFSPIFDDADCQTLPCDTVLLAVGQVPVTSFLDAGGADIEMTRPGWPKIDAKTLATTAPGVFVAGDLAHGTRLAIDAVASGKAAARSVYTYLTGRPLELQSVTSHLPLPGYHRELGYERIRRQAVPVREPGDRLDHPLVEVERGFDEATAMCEASRCLDCGVTPVFDGNRCVLCGGCADVCPTECLKLVTLARLEPAPALDAVIGAALGEDPNADSHSAIVKDEDRCIRCALCVMRCPVDAIGMERVMFSSRWVSP
ncbi:MAG: 4Fe-4S dicluster domain-containing protein [Acidimicrobiia bacterium]|nr:4Fe-4S dicluster domain-containing protein [Acidimicrobiia bacterium]